MSSFCSAKATHIFSAKNIRILCIESAKTVNEMTLNELVNDALNTWAQSASYYFCISERSLVHNILLSKQLLFTLVLLNKLRCVTGYRYITLLYCLAVQAGFYSDVVECWPVTQAALVRYRAAALVIRIFSPVTSGAQRGAPD